VHETGEIDAEEHTPHGTALRGRVDAGLASELTAAAVQVR
jgi:GTP-binding protein HflX